MGNLGFDPGVANSGFAMGQSLKVKGAMGGMLQDLMTAWKTDMAKKQEQQYKLQQVEAEQKFQQQYPTPFEQMIMNQSGEAGIETTMPTTAQEAEQLYTQQNPNISPEDLTTKPIYSSAKGRKYISGYQAELTPEAEQRQKESAKQQIKSRELVKQFSFIQDDFKTLKDSLSKIPAGRVKGTLAIPGAWVGAKGSEYTFNYTRNRDLILSKIAKTFGGEVGVLTEGDIKRIRDAFPALWMNPTEREFQIKWIEDYIQRRISAYQSLQTKTISQQSQLPPGFSSDEWEVVNE